MKIKSLIVFVVGFFAHLAVAQDLALVTKTNNTGFVMPEYARTEICEVFRNKVVITKKFGIFSENSFTSKEVRRINLSPSIKNTLQVAATEPLLESGNFLCDAPSTSIASNVAGEKIILFSSGGCGSPRLERQGGAAQMLKDLVAAYCPVTHDLGIQDTIYLD